MAKDHPRIFNSSITSPIQLEDMEAISKILQRLLTGLIPIRGEALDYCVVEIEGVEYVVHKNAITELEFETKPLVIVGVTDHLAYWKDIRRVLFSDSEFTILCRISKTGLQNSWLPVKLADLLKNVAPDVADQITFASHMNFYSTSKTQSESQKEAKFRQALLHYKSDLLRTFDHPLTDSEEKIVISKIEEIKHKARSVTEQCDAFAELRESISKITKASINPVKDAEFKENARNSCGVALLPNQDDTEPELHQPHSTSSPISKEKLLDVEVVAMYW